MQALINLFYFLIALGVLVTIHEWGHFWVARRLGVKVLTFSFGFGPALYRRTGKDGVCYQIAAIPLGGYVKMLDGREMEVTPEQREQAFDAKPLWVRSAVVLAGPVANFLLAAILYWVIFSVGITGLSSKVGAVTADSIAEQIGLKPGDILTKVDGHRVETASDVIKRLALRLGESGTLSIEVEREDKDNPILLSTELRNWRMSDEETSLLKQFGIIHIREALPAKIAQVGEASPAAEAGLNPGDVIVSFNGQPVKTWNQLVELIAVHAGETVSLEIKRDGELLQKSVVIGKQRDSSGTRGYLGVAVDLQGSFVRVQASSILDAFLKGLQHTWDTITLSAGLFAKLVLGELSLKTLSGPIAIAEGAAGSAAIGLVYFLSFLALISVNLGFINLLPIPMLDGGHLLYFAVEWLRGGKPLPEKVQILGIQIGLVLVLAMMAIAIMNDIAKL